MNSKIYGFGVIILISGIIVFNSFSGLNNTKEELEDELAYSKREIEELEERLTSNEDFVDIKLEKANAQLDEYGDLIYKIAQKKEDILVKAYDIEAIVYTADGSFPLPKSGKIDIDSDYFELLIKVTIPPMYAHDKVNDIIHNYDNMFIDTTYDQGAEYLVSENTLSLKYTDLKYGDNINIELNSDLNSLLELISKDITVNITKDYIKPDEYLGLNIKKKVFTGDDYEIMRTFEYLSDNLWIVKQELSKGHKIRYYKYEYDKSLKISEFSVDGINYYAFNKLILPEKICLGSTWNFERTTAVITAVDYQLITSFGVLETIEITYTDEDDGTEYKNYYAKKYGLVSSCDTNLDDELMEVEYIE